MAKRITPKQARALPLLAAGMSGAETAKAINVKASTISLWLNHDENFLAELEQLRTTATEQALGRLQATLDSAVSEVRRIMSESKNDGVRLRAAMFLIESVGRQKSIADLRLDHESRAELAMVNQILVGLGINHAATG